MAEQPWHVPSERVWMALRSAWIPAPPPESEPAMVYMMEGAAVILGIVWVFWFWMMSLDEAANAAVDGSDNVMWNRMFDRQKQWAWRREKERGNIIIIVALLAAVNAQSIYLI